MSKRILITGGAGYIGSHTIAEIFAHTDWEVLSIDNYCNSSKDTYDRLQRITGREVAHEEVDLKDHKALRKIFAENRFDGVIHFAAFKAVGESVSDPLAYYHNNLGGLVNLLECQKEFNVKTHLFSSSCTVYGNPASLPVTEDHQMQTAESPYGATKVMGERILEDASNAMDIHVLALRYFNPVGAHSSGTLGELPLGVPNNLVPFITQTAAGHRDELTIFGGDYDTRDGTCIRDYIHVSDIAHAHVLGMQLLLNEGQQENFDFINLGTGNGVSVKEIVDAFQLENDISLNYKIGPRRAGDVVEIYADNSKAEQVLGWIPQSGLKEMVTSAWKWQQYLDSQSL